jgi:histone deacetylase 11
MGIPIESGGADRMSPRIVYSRHYNIGFFGLERLHPFDSRKYGRAWRILRRRFGRNLRELWMRPAAPVGRDELLRVHSGEYLDRLQDSHVVARALELPVVANFPGSLVDRYILRPMRWATAGTIEAASAAMAHGLAINLSGGYHHARPDGGEGFCIYADAALAIDRLRHDQLLGEHDRIVHIDLDVHQGNGVCHCFRDDRAVFLFDMFNPAIYPAYDRLARERLDCAAQVPPGSTGQEYLRLLTARLPAFLDGVSKTSPVRFAIYNAGTDIYEHDSLGGLNVSHEAIVERDWFVVDQLVRRGIPTLLLLSGGYHRDNYKIIADSLINILLRTSHEPGDESSRSLPGNPQL